MADQRILDFRRQLSELARKLAIEQGHYPASGPKLQHTMEPEEPKQESTDVSNG